MKRPIKQVVPFLSCLTIVSSAGLSTVSASAEEIKKPVFNVTTEYIEPQILNLNSGDVNTDGTIDEKDLQLLKDYLDGKVTFTSDNEKTADYNGDGSIDNKDVEELEKWIYKISGYKDPHDVSLTVSEGVDHNIFNIIGTFGDVDEDGLFTDNDVNIMVKAYYEEVSLSEKQISNADYNQNEILDSEDISEAYKVLVSTFSSDKFTYEKDESNYDIKKSKSDKLKTVLLWTGDESLAGDVDGDGFVTFSDTEKIIKYLDGQGKMTDMALQRADANQDGIISYEDVAYNEAAIMGIKPQLNAHVEKWVTPEDYEKYYKNKETSEDATLNNVDINSTEPTQPSESSEPSSETAEETRDESLKLGDINLDGDVTIADAILLNKYLVGSVTLSEASQKNADCDKDGKLTSSDTLVILDYVVGSIDEIK